MTYATWKLNFTDPNYGTGPEPAIVKQGATAEGAHTNGDVTTGAKILGYFTGNPKNLAAWDFEELTQEQALDFVLSVNPDAYFLDDGRIVAPMPDTLSN